MQFASLMMCNLHFGGYFRYLINMYVFLFYAMMLLQINICCVRGAPFRNLFFIGKLHYCGLGQKILSSY